MLKPPLSWCGLAHAHTYGQNAKNVLGRGSASQCNEDFHALRIRCWQRPLSRARAKFDAVAVFAIASHTGRFLLTSCSDRRSCGQSYGRILSGKGKAVSNR